MNRIKEVLKDQGITQTELASRLGLPKTSITQLLTIGNPNLKTLESVANALGVPVWELLVSREEMKDEFYLDIVGVVKVNGVTHSIESTEDLEKIIGMIKKEHQDIIELQPKGE